MTALAALDNTLADCVRDICTKLPPLPSAVRYYDDYNGVFHSVVNLAKSNKWLLHYDGYAHEVDFTSHPDHLIFPMKHAVVRLLAANSPAMAFDCLKTVAAFCARNANSGIIEKMIVVNPAEFRAEWIKTVSPSASNIETSRLKSLLYAFCDIKIGPWTPAHYDIVAALPKPQADSYRVVRTGDCFMPLDQQSSIIDYIDEMATLVVINPSKVGTNSLRNVCMLIVSFQYAFRAGQIARIRMSDVRTYETGAVHFSAILTKKKNAKERERVTRRIKREWCPLFVELLNRRRDGRCQPLANAPSNTFFGLPPAQVGARIRRLTIQITGSPWSTTDLRHTAAQRQVDAGVAHVTLTEFMGHSSLKTANVYFDTSPTQAQRVNQALALSPIFSTVAEVARTKTVDRAALLASPEDMQIGGVPHGVPIAGIGICGIGQSLCSKNPILSCYTCRKFMPVSDTYVHQGVLNGLRPVVLQFEVAAKGNTVSPAYTQLRRTLTAVEAVMRDIEASDGGDNE